MKIAHLAAYENRNAGDSALQYGLRRVLHEDWDGELEFVSVHVTKALDFMETINGCDLCLIGGGGLLSPDKTPSGYMVPFGPRHLEKIKPPIVVYGVGHNLFKGQELPAGCLEPLREAALAYSMRHDGSWRRAGWLYDVDIVPDPGMWVEADETDEHYDVVLQLAGNLLKDRVGDVAQFMAGVRKLVEGLLERGLSVIAVSHIKKDDPYVKQCAEWGAAVRLADGRRDLKRIREFFGVYENARCVIAMRGHAQICAYGLNVPFLTLATQDKNVGFLEDISYITSEPSSTIVVYPNSQTMPEYYFYDDEPWWETAGFFVGMLIAEDGPRHKLRAYREWAREYHKRIQEQLRNV